MSRPTTRKPDNIFIALLHFLDGQGLSVSLRVLLLPFLLIVLAIGGSAWLVNQQHKEVSQLQIQAIGNTLADQIAGMARVPMHDNDLISLQATLDTLKGNPLVRHAAVHSIDKRLLAEIGTPVRHGFYDNGSTEFSRPISMMDVAKGQLYLTIDNASFSAPVTSSVTNIALLGLLLGLVAWVLGRRLGEQLRQPLVDLQEWLQAPNALTPGTRRRDEIGELARLLEARLVPSLPAAPAEFEFEDDARFRIQIDEELLRELTLADTEREMPKINPATWGNLSTPVTERLQEQSTQKARRQEPQLNIDSDFQIDLDNLVIDFDDSTPVKRPPKPQTPQRDDEAEIQLPQSLLDSLRFDNLPPRPEPVAAETTAAATSAEQPADFTAPAQLMSAVLAVHVGNHEDLRQLPHQRLLALLQRYRNGLEETARQFQGSLYRLDDGGSLILFHSNQSGDHYLQRALCCGEQLRALGLALQAEIADTGLSLVQQLAMDQGEGLYGQPLRALLRIDSCLNVLELRQRSRNLLLLADGLGQDPGLRSFATLRDLPPPITTLCVESLAAPWPGTIHQQLKSLLGK